MNVASSVVGTYSHLITPGAMQRAAGSNALTATATLVTGLVLPPTAGKRFLPTTTLADGTSTRLLTLGNQNTRAGTLPSPFTASLPASSGNSAISYAKGADRPVGGCTISVSVSSLVAGISTNVVAAAALATDLGSNAAGATAGLAVTPAGLLSITKTNSQTTVTVGATTTYTLMITTSGPSDVGNATVADMHSQGLGCLPASVSCVATGRAQCPATFSNLSGVGSVTPQRPSGTSLTINAVCQITAKGAHLLLFR